MTRTVACVLAILFGILPTASSTTYVREPTLKDLAQVWVGGVPRNLLEYFRLELNAQGIGILTVQYLPNEPAVAYEVRGTRLVKYSVAFDLLPIDKDAAPIYLRGTATPITMDLEVGGTTPDWQRRVFLQTYSDLAAKLEAVTERARAYAEQAKK